MYFVFSSSTDISGKKNNSIRTMEDTKKENRYKTNIKIIIFQKTTIHLFFQLSEKEEETKKGKQIDVFLLKKKKRE